MNKENIICNEEIYIPVNIQTNSKNGISDLIDQKSLLKTKESIHSIVNVQPNENMNLKYLEKYKEVYIPKIYLMEYNDPKNMNMNLIIFHQLKILLTFKIILILIMDII